MQRLLFLSGLSDNDPATAANDAQSIEALRMAWFQKSDHRLNRYEEMFQAFQTTFHEQFSSWVPYLFVYIGNGIRHATAEQEQAVITFLRNMEQHLTKKSTYRLLASVMLERSQSHVWKSDQCLREIGWHRDDRRLPL